MTPVLAQLLDAIRPEIVGVTGPTRLAITSVTPDSRSVVPGALFVAVPGTVADGHDYIKEAVGRGAAGVLLERPNAAAGVRGAAGLPTCVQVANCRRAIGPVAAAFHGWPAEKLRVVGVTGTNGKTTTTYLVRALLAAAGRKVGLLGTVGYAIGDQTWPAAHTTPESHVLQEWLARMVAAGVTDVVMEASSHALAQERVRGCEYDVAVFTNLTQDHLDFHGTLEAYYAAKRRLFESLGAPGRKSGLKRAVINVDDPWGRRLAAETATAKWSYGFSAAAELRATEVCANHDGLRFDLATPAGPVAIRSPLLGRYNVWNLLAAIGAGLHLGVALEAVARGVETLRGVPGRFEPVIAGQPFTVVVDYAHTEDALDRLLAAAGDLAPRRIVTVFGCGGDRDPGKRAPMGRVAARRSDWVIVTSDNPRREDPLAILRAIEQGVRAEAAAGGRTRGYDIVPERAEAIERAVAMAQPADLVVIAGKGHEDYQIIGTTRFAFDDRQVARAAIERRYPRGRA